MALTSAADAGTWNLEPTVGSIRYEVSHRTEYAYAAPVGFGRHVGMIHPRAAPNQRLLSADLVVHPTPARVERHSDPLENAITEATFETRANRLVFDMASSVEVTPFHDLDRLLAPSAIHHPFRYASADQSLLAPAMADPDLAGPARDWARAVRGGEHYLSTLSLLQRLNRAIREQFRYERREACGVQNPSDTVQIGAGTCRDFALLALCVLRHWRFAARFVSGYLHVPDYEPERVKGGGAMHAWVQVFLPGIGWLDLDPTNNRLGNDGLISVAVGLEPDNIVTIGGSYVGRANLYEGMTVWVQVRRVETVERPRLAPVH